MSTLQAEFEFEIGDFVFFKSELLGSQRPRAFIVEGRRIEQCHGGIQTHYALTEDKSWVTSIALAKVDVSFAASASDVGRRGTWHQGGDQVNLRDAITKLQDVPRDRPIRWPVEELSVVLAAARAFSCEACNGSGYTFTERFCTLICPECREDREKARGQ